ncbi:hypothetical protein D3C85_1509780 [compost metagenome]
MLQGAPDRPSAEQHAALGAEVAGGLPGGAVAEQAVDCAALLELPGTACRALGPIGIDDVVRQGAGDALDPLIAQKFRVFLALDGQQQQGSSVAVKAVRQQGIGFSDRGENRHSVAPWSSVAVLGSAPDSGGRRRCCG